MNDHWKRYVFLPDYQVPYHNKRITSLLCDFVGDYQPEQLFHVGDLIDMPSVSRWCKGTAGEFTDSLAADIAITKQLLDDIRNAYTGPFAVKRGNHDMRAEVYLKRYAPALAGMLRFEDLLDLGDLDIDYHRDMFDVAPGWVLAHGDEGSMSRTPGGTATALAARIGKSVVCGHTHKAALKAAVGGPQGYNGKIAPTLWGMEVGNAMDVKQAGYLRTGAALWQYGLGILYVKGSTVIPSLIPIAPNGLFIVEGQVYGEKRAA